MNMRATDEAIRNALTRQAAFWQARNVEGELSAAEKIEFLEWLRISPNNIEAYLRTVQMTQALPRALKDVSIDYKQPVAELAAIDNVVPLEAARVGLEGKLRGGRIFGTRGKILSIAAVLILGICASWGITRFMEGSQISVPHGDQRTLRLDDGSVAHLNSESRIRVDFTARERLIELESGQALFKVAHDRSRPFVVRTGTADVVAVGTQFEVYRRPANTTVTVVEGKVEVLSRHDQQSDFLSSPGAVAPAIRLTAGERVQVEPGSQVTTPVEIDVRDATAWTRREISFRARPLGDVADEYARYLDKPIRIDDESLRNTRVTGLFQAYEPEPFLKFLRSFPDVVVEEKAQGIYVRRREQ